MAYNQYKGYKWIRNQRRETLNHCVVQLKYRIRFTLFSAKLFPFTSIFFPLSTYPLCCTQTCSWPKSSSFHSLAQRQKVSLIWSSCSQTVSASHSLLVTANITAAFLFFKTPPLVFIFFILTNEHTSLRSISLNSIRHRLDHGCRDRPMGENGGGIFGLICYCMELTTLTL